MTKKKEKKAPAHKCCCEINDLNVPLQRIVCTLCFRMHLKMYYEKETSNECIVYRTIEIEVHTADMICT